MSDGHGGDCGGHEGGTGCGDTVDVGAPIPGAAEDGSYAETAAPELPVVNGVEINRAKILEKSHQQIVRK